MGVQICRRSTSTVMQKRWQGQAETGAIIFVLLCLSCTREKIEPRISGLGSLSSFYCTTNPHPSTALLCCSLHLLCDNSWKQSVCTATTNIKPTMKNKDKSPSTWNLSILYTPCPVDKYKIIGTNNMGIYMYKATKYVFRPKIHAKDIFWQSAVYMRVYCACTQILKYVFL